MLKRHGICASLFLLVLLLADARAQVDTGKSDTLDALPVIACETGGRVRFTAPGTVVQIRLEIYRENGEKLFDNESRGGNVMDWLLQDGQAERLSDGSYLGVVTVKSSSGRMSQKLGRITIQNAAAGVQPIDPTQLTTQQSQAVGPLEQNASLMVLKEGETQTPAVIAHDGTDGQLTRGKGALSFRLGDFFSGKDTEQMRLTAEGDLGIGVTQPQAKLDVDGTIRASQGIVFPDGSTQFSAASKTLGAKSTAGDQGSGSKNREQPQSTGTGTAGKIPLWTDSSGTLGDSVVTQSNGLIGIGTTSPSGPLTVDSSTNPLPPGSGSLFIQGNANKERIEMRSASSVGAGPAVQGRGYAGTIASPGATQVGGNLMIIGGSGHNGSAGESGIVTVNAATIKMKAEENWTPSANGAFISLETTTPGNSSFARAERMRITGGGNVGIGTPSPQQNLSVNAGMVVDQAGANGGTVNPGITFGSNSGEGIASKRTSGGNQFGLDFFTGSANRMSILNGGNVGIGTTAPGSQLEVRRDGNIGSNWQNAQLRIGGATDSRMQVNFGYDTTNNLGVIQAGQANVAFTNLSLNPFGGSVGIGTASPAAKLDVEGAIGSAPLSIINNTNTSGNSGPTLRLAGSGNAAHGVLSVGALGTGKIATFESLAGEVASIDVNGNIAANNLPGLQFSGCSVVDGQSTCNLLGPGQSQDFDKITVNVPAPGFLSITASIKLVSQSQTSTTGLAQFNLFKCDTDQCGGGVYLIRAGSGAHDQALSSVGETTITYSWVLQVDTAGPVTLKTNGTNDNSFADIYSTYHSLTAIYLPKQY